MIVGWLNVRLLEVRGVRAGRRRARRSTPAPAIARRPQRADAEQIATSTTASSIRPSGSRAGRLRALARRVPRSARVRGDSRSGRAPRGQPSRGTGHRASWLNERSGRSSPSHCRNRRCSISRTVQPLACGLEAMGQGDEVGRPRAASSRRPRGARPAIVPPGWRAGDAGIDPVAPGSTSRNGSCRRALRAALRSACNPAGPRPLQSSVMATGCRARCDARRRPACAAGVMTGPAGRGIMAPWRAPRRSRRRAATATRPAARRPTRRSSRRRTSAASACSSTATCTCCPTRSATSTRIRAASGCTTSTPGSCRARSCGSTASARRSCGPSRRRTTSARSS